MCLVFIEQVPYEDLLDASELLIQAITLRWDYCKPSFHSFPSTTARYLHIDEHNLPDGETVHGDKKTVEGTVLHCFFLFTRTNFTHLSRYYAENRLTMCNERRLSHNIFAGAT